MMKFVVRKAKKVELSSLIPLYQSVFTKHNLFQQSRREIRHYIQETQRKHARQGGGYLVAAADKKVVGAILIRKEAEMNKHALWRLNHLAVRPEYQGKGIGTALLEEAEKMIIKSLRERKLQTAKIEIGVAENESRAVSFYQRQGFTIEGKLQSHYRFNEMVYVMGKEIRI